MKKRTLSLILAASMLAMAGCAAPAAAPAAPAAQPAAEAASEESAEEVAEEETEAAEAATEIEAKTNLKVAYTANSLSNDLNIETMAPIKEICNEKGFEYTEISYDSDVAKLVDTLENFLIAGMDIVMFQSVGGEAVNDVVQRLKDSGCIVISYDDPAHVGTYYLTQSDAEIGKAIGEAAAKYVNENYDGKADAVAMGLPSNETLTVRCNSAIEAFEANCEGKCLFTYDLANYSGDYAAIADSMSQAYSDAKVVLSIADAVNVPLQEGLMSVGYNYGDIGLFGCDTIREVRTAWIEGTDTMCVASAWTYLPQRMMDAFMMAVEDKESGTVRGGEVHQDAVATTPENVKEVLGLE